MSISIQTDATGAGSGTVRADLAAAHLLAISNLDTGFGVGPTVGNLQPVTYARSETGVCPVRLDALVNTDWPLTPGGPDVIVLAVGANFTLVDGSLITNVGGTALPPAGSGMPGSTLNTSASTLVLYDTSDNNGQGYCLARAGTGGTMDLRLPLSVTLYHELSHAFRIVQSALLALTAACNPSSPEEHAAIVDENDMRTQLAVQTGQPAVLRDPGIHCGQSCGGGGSPGSCCIVASVSSGSPLSGEVQQLRALREQFLRRSEVGFAYFDALHHAYYGFSPQVVTVMATDLGLRTTVLDGFVRPLIRMLQTVRDHALDDVPVPELARRLVADLDPSDCPDGRHGTDGAGAPGLMERAAALLGGADVPLGANERAVRALLVDRALPDPHVHWGLVEPVVAYHDLLRRWWRSEGLDSVSDGLAQFLAEWGGRLPIAPRWGSLSRGRVQRELRSLDTTLLRTPQARRTFRERLLAELGGATAVRTAVAATSDPAWGFGPNANLRGAAS